MCIFSEKSRSSVRLTEKKNINRKRSTESAYTAEVFHRHPRSGHVKVGCLAPLSLHIFIVLLLIFKLWVAQKCDVRQLTVSRQLSTPTFSSVHVKSDKIYWKWLDCHPFFDLSILDHCALILVSSWPVIPSSSSGLAGLSGTCFYVDKARQMLVWAFKSPFSPCYFLNNVHPRALPYPRMIVLLSVVRLSVNLGTVWHCKVIGHMYMSTSELML